MSDIETLPAGWTRANLADVIAARTERVKPQDFPNLPFVGLGNIEAQSMRLLKAAIASEVKSSCFRFRSGDVLYSRLRPYLNKVTQPSFDGVCSAELIVLQPSGVLTSDFLQYRLNAADFVEFTSGLNAGDRPRVDLTEIGRFETLIPPAREQKRISDRIKSLLANLECGMSGLAQAMANLSRYQESVLHSAVTGSLTAEWRAANPAKEDGKALLERILRERRERWEKEQLASFAAKDKQPPKGWREKYEEPPAPDTTQLPELPEGWAWAALEQIAPTSGGITKHSERERLPTKLPYLRVANVYSNELRLDEIEYIGVGDQEVQRVLLQKGDLLIVEGNGSKDQIGRLAMWNGAIENCIHQNHLIKCRPLGGEVAAKWIMLTLLSPLGRAAIENVAQSTSGLYTLSLSKVGRLPIPLPPTAERDIAARSADQSLSICADLQQSVANQLPQIQTLRQSIFKAAFEGRLVPQDSSDEPASALLERITAKSSAAIATKAKITTRRKAAAK